MKNYPACKELSVIKYHHKYSISMKCYCVLYRLCQELVLKFNQCILYKYLDSIKIVFINELHLCIYHELTLCIHFFLKLHLFVMNYLGNQYQTTTCEGQRSDHRGWGFSHIQLLHSLGTSIFCVFPQTTTTPPPSPPSVKKKNKN